MKTIDLNFPLTEIDGTSITPELNAGKVLAKNLVQTAKGDPIKHFEWALKLSKGEALELDTSDYKYLKGFVEKHETLIILVKAQILSKFD